MLLLGTVEERNVYYQNLYNEPVLDGVLPNSKSVVFTIIDKVNKDLTDYMVNECINRNVPWTCSAGELADATEWDFDMRVVDRMDAAGELTVDMATVAIRNVDECFWFATITADRYGDIVDNVICLDLTEYGIQSKLVQLIQQINEGWLPPDED